MVQYRIFTAFLVPALTFGFMVPCQFGGTRTRAISVLAKRSSSGGGFGKVEQPKKKQSTKPAEDAVAPQKDGPVVDQEQGSPFLQSVEGGGSSNVPQIDESLEPEERAKKLLKEKYGMKTLEEQQLSVKQLELRKERQKQLADWKKKAELDQEIDFMSMIPGEVQVAIDIFLKAGLAICTILFVAAGGGITVEAWSKASNNPLPEDMDNFISTVIEPNFTTGLFVLLGFSISLGVFASLQLSSSGAQYKESD